MTMKVTKFSLEPEKIELGLEFKIQLPVRAEILSIRTIREIPAVFALVDDNEKMMEERQLIVINTGMTFEVASGNVYNHLGVFPLGNDILHLFEITKKKRR